MSFRRVLSDCTVELAECWASLPLASLVDAVALSCLAQVPAVAADPSLIARDLLARLPPE